MRFLTKIQSKYEICARKFSYQHLMTMNFEDWLKEVGGLEDWLAEKGTDWRVYGNVKKEALGLLRKRAENNFQAFRKKYSTFPSVVTLYRCISLKNIESLKTDRIGIFWADEVAHAVCYSGKSGDDWILSAKIPLSSIDWKETFSANMNLDIGEEEQEITLKEGAPLTIDSARKKSDKEWKKVNIKGHA